MRRDGLTFRFALIFILIINFSISVYSSELSKITLAVIESSGKNDTMNNSDNCNVDLLNYSMNIPLWNSSFESEDDLIYEPCLLLNEKDKVSGYDKKNTTTYPAQDSDLNPITGAAPVTQKNRHELDDNGETITNNGSFVSIIIFVIIILIFNIFLILLRKR